MMAPGLAGGEGEEATGVEDRREEDDRKEESLNEGEAGDEKKGAGLDASPAAPEAGGLDDAAASLVALLPSR
jgi:hypothetical protein